MTLAAQPQTDLKNKLTANQAVEAAYAKIQKDVDALQTAAQAITTPSTWSATAATASDASVAVTSSASSTVGSLAFRVSQLATGQAMLVNQVADMDALVKALETTAMRMDESDGKTISNLQSKGEEGSIEINKGEVLSSFLELLVVARPLPS